MDSQIFNDSLLYPKGIFKVFLPAKAFLFPKKILVAFVKVT